MADSAICSIPDCINTAKVRGWCKKHYDRWRRKGSPTAPFQRPPNGAAQDFFRDVVCTYEGDECLIWPFHRMKNGYAVLNRPDRPYLVSRLSCEEEHGPPPFDGAQAAHSCGRGKDGCVSRRHLSWKTPTQNAADKVQHGTLLKGINHPASKLTHDDVRQIRKLCETQTVRAVARQFGVGHATINRIRWKQAWAEVS